MILKSKSKSSTQNDLKSSVKNHTDDLKSYDLKSYPTQYTDPI